MAFTINTNLVFIDSMQFINCSLDSLVKNLSDNDFKYFSGKFSGELLRLVKQKGGGISYITKRHSKANNKYMQSYDAKKPSKLITYLDANNLYGWTMNQYLPYGRFKWLTQKEISDFCLNSVSEYCAIVYVLEVDLECPSELHDLHNDYPLAPENLKLLKICCQIIVLILPMSME